jgi:hypothetical protein
MWRTGSVVVVVDEVVVEVETEVDDDDVVDDEVLDGAGAAVGSESDEQPTTRTATVVANAIERLTVNFSPLERARVVPDRPPGRLVHLARPM